MKPKNSLLNDFSSAVCERDSGKKGKDWGLVVKYSENKWLLQKWNE